MSTFLINKIYSSVVFIFSLVALPFFLLHPSGKKRFFERYGCWNLKEKAPIIWLHGASVGEIKGLIPVINTIKDLLPEYKILLSATSPSG